MEIVSFIYCDDVTNDPNTGNNIILTPLQMFSPINIPSNYSFTVSFGLFDILKDKENVINVAFVNSNDEELISNNLILPTIPEPIKQTPGPIGVQINIGFRNVILNTTGIYKTVVTINDEVLGSYPIHVVCGKQ